jgi:hypothetical protein
MSAFTQKDNPVGRYLANGKDFLLMQNLVYHVGEEGSEEVIIVPEGSVTDWASIPELIRPLLPNTYGKRAAVVHDYLYRTLGLGGLYDRKRCDEIFLEALKVLGVPWRIRQALYTGVRIGGWVPWSKVQKEKQKQQYENEDRPYY